MRKSSLTQPRVSSIYPVYTDTVQTSNIDSWILYKKFELKPMAGGLTEKWTWLTCTN